MPAALDLNPAPELIRLVQLASRFTTFFEKLVEVIQKVAECFPYYDEIANLAQAIQPSRIGSHLERVYGDLLHFFQDVVEVFASRSGSTSHSVWPTSYLAANNVPEIRRTPFVIRDLLWTPFNSRFNDFLHKLSGHQQLVHEELTLLHIEASRAAEGAASWERKLAAEERHRADEARAKLDQSIAQTNEVRQNICKQESGMCKPPRTQATTFAHA